jgi:hypothetical protein
VKEDEMSDEIRTLLARLNADGLRKLAASLLGVADALAAVEAGDPPMRLWHVWHREDASREDFTRRDRNIIIAPTRDEALLLWCATRRRHYTPDEADAEEISLTKAGALS